jgi:hypothetical protein
MPECFTLSRFLKDTDKMQDIFFLLGIQYEWYGSSSGTDTLTVLNPSERFEKVYWVIFAPAINDSSVSGVLATLKHYLRAD